MIASPLVLSNLIYLVGAVGVAVLVSVIYVLWHRRPESVEDHMATFTKRLAALEAVAPERDDQAGPPRKTDPAALPSLRGNPKWDRRRPAMAPPRSVPSRAVPAGSAAPARPVPIDRMRSQSQRPESHTG